jgi:hypothetical protein
MKTKLTFLFGVAAIGFLAVGCDQDPACPDNGVYGKYGCGPAPADAAAIVDAGGNANVDANMMGDAAIDAAKDAGIADTALPKDTSAVTADAMSNTSDAGGDASATLFGVTCSSSAECIGDTDYCNKGQGAATGYCTHTGCLATPSICPATWTCFNLGMFQAGLPAVCRKP